LSSPIVVGTVTATAILLMQRLAAAARR